MKNVVKKEKVDDFIGTEFLTPKGGILKVVGVLDKKHGSHKRYTCKCSICSKDEELFPSVFDSLKGTLVGSKKHKPCIPCGCSKSPNWSKRQYEVLVNREAEKRGYTFNGWCGEPVRHTTNLKLYNPITGNSWDTTSVERFLSGSGDPIQGYANMKKAQATPQLKREEQLIGICKEEGLTFVGWVEEGYVNNKSKLKWICNKGHLCENTTVANFLKGKRCPTCNNLEGFNGYYKSRTNEIDYLYVMDLISSTKIGRSFDVSERSKGIKNETNFNGKPDVVQLYTATHQVIYDTEQEILETLRKAGYQYSYDWTNEAFHNECSELLQERLDYYVSIGTLTKIDYEGK